MALKLRGTDKLSKVKVNRKFKYYNDSQQVERSRIFVGVKDNSDCSEKNLQELQLLRIEFNSLMLTEIGFFLIRFSKNYTSIKNWCSKKLSIN